MGRERRSSWMFAVAIAGVVVMVSALLTGASASGANTTSKKAGPEVLYVGTFNGITTPPAQTFSTIQAAVDAAVKGDTILIAPGDYHESGDTGSSAPTPSEVAEGWYGGVDITTPDLTLRGMNRNSVIVDGTLSSAATPCSGASGDQNSLAGEGRNGIVVWKADGVNISNLTVCNFIAGSGSSGNEIWWNGGDGSGKVGLKGYSGSYLTATSTYFQSSDPSHPNVCGTCALYGIFSSNSEEGTWTQLYANNFADSGMYVGACLRKCDVTISDATMENNALGYSGTNSGGQIVIENSTFDNNKEGVDTNTALTGDPPPPQDGRCKGKASSPITHTGSCWVFTGNLVANNNDPNVPIAGTAGLGPTGTGMTVSGGRNDTVTGNEFLDNGAWGILFVPYPDSNTSSDGRTCLGTKGVLANGLVAGIGCLYDPMGDALVGNKFSGNGSFGNPSNADYGNLLIAGHEPQDCFVGNTEWDSTFTTDLGPAKSGNSSPSFDPTVCGPKTAKTGLLGSNTDLTLLVQAECDSGVLSSGCSGAVYPQPTSVVMEPLPSLPSMPNPCAGVPANLWCPGGAPAAPKS